MSINLKRIEPKKHHEQNDVCATRARYRQGRKDTAVKVYTINQESKYLLIFNVPAVGAQDELRQLCEEFGEITRLDAVHEYPCEEFTEVYVVCYQKIQTSKFVKRKLDGRSFFGGVLHVCYAPEFESVEDTRQKLIGRTRYISQLTNSGPCGPWTKSNFAYKPKPTCEVPIPPTYTRVADPSSEANFVQDNVASSSGSSGTYIWAGKVYSLQQAALPTAPDVVEPPAITPPPPPSTVTHLLPRHLRPSKRKKLISVPRLDQLTSSDNDSYGNTSADIRNKMKQHTTPTLATCFKKKKSF